MDAPNPESQAQREVGREAATETSELFGLLAHLYRGELQRANSWRQRLDRTTNWAVVLAASLMTWSFSSADRPHYVVLIGMVATGFFLWIEARRYRIYDVWRSRVRMLEENLLGNALDPRGVEETRWRALLSEDLREPTVKLPFLEAVSRRLRRVYLWILSVFLLAWVLRITAFAPDGTGIREAAAVGRISGTAVIFSVVVAYACMYTIAVWPMERRAKGKVEEPTEYGEWRDRDDEGGDAGTRRA